MKNDILPVLCPLNIGLGSSCSKFQRRLLAFQRILNIKVSSQPVYYSFHTSGSREYVFKMNQ